MSDNNDNVKDSSWRFERKPPVVATGDVNANSVPTDSKSRGVAASGNSNGGSGLSETTSRASGTSASIDVAALARKLEEVRDNPALDSVSAKAVADEVVDQLISAFKADPKAVLDAMPEMMQDSDPEVLRALELGERMRKDFMEMIDVACAGLRAKYDKEIHAFPSTMGLVAYIDSMAGVHAVRLGMLELGYRVADAPPALFEMVVQEGRRAGRTMLAGRASSIANEKSGDVGGLMKIMEHFEALQGEAEKVKKP